MILNFAASLFSIITTAVVFGVLVMFYQITLPTFLLFGLFLLVRYYSYSKKEKLKPNYQNGGRFPEGVKEDYLDNPLSFTPKK